MPNHTTKAHYSIESVQRGLLLIAKPHARLAAVDARLKLIALLVLAFAISAIDRLEWLPLAWLPVLLVLWLEPRSWHEWWQRLRYPSLLIVVLIILLPVLTGSTPLLSWMGLTLTSEGLAAAVLITGRSYAILILAFALLGSSPLLDNLRALQRLGVPDLMVDLALLVVRYIEVVASDLRQMRRAMQLRGLPPRRLSWRNLRATAWLLGSLLVRSHERSQRVYLAMRLRGYGS